MCIRLHINIRNEVRDVEDLRVYKTLFKKPIVLKPSETAAVPSELWRPCGQVSQVRLDLSQ